MKVKYLIVVSLVLAILTIGAVSASQNLTEDTLSQDVSDEAAVQEAADDVSDESSDDVLAQSDEDEISKQIDDEPEDDVGSNVSSEDLLGDYYNGNVHIEVYDTVDLSYSFRDLGYVEDEDGIKGTVSVSIDGKKIFSKKFTSGKTTYYMLNSYEMDLKNCAYGYHTVKITYNDGKVKSDSRKVNFIYTPRITTPEAMSVGETNYVIFKVAKGLTGSVTLYARDVAGYDKDNNTIYKKGAAITTVKIKDGYALISLKNLKPGDPSFKLEYTVGTYSSSKVFYVHVENNAPGYSSSISAKSIYEGKAVTIKLTGPKVNRVVTIHVDGKYLKEVKLSSGSIKEVISGLTEGTHFISITQYYYSGGPFYSNTFKVVVKPKVTLTLQKVIIKKSAKKLVLKATLKIYKKPAKGKKLVFKFKGKKYIAKTNKKGIAKITIKKSVLKKLKVGKKVKYQVTYSKKTAKQTVKVRK